MITPFASEPNSAASIHDFQNNTSRHLLLHREATMKSTALGSARDAAGKKVWREAQPRLRAPRSFCEAIINACEDHLGQFAGTPEKLPPLREGSAAPIRPPGLAG
jgi:hypothetical protein